MKQTQGRRRMRDLVFKNLTCPEKKRKILASSEITEGQGVRCIIRRHFVFIAKEVQGAAPKQKPLPYLYVLKERNTREQREKFFCRIKGSIYAINNGKLFLILFMHSLKINFVPLQQSSVHCS
jgi:hypothetical protein